MKERKTTFKVIYIDDINNNKELINELSNKIFFFLKKINIKKSDHILIIGLGNENLASDSIGPKTLKHINVNSYLENLGIDIVGNKVSALEPGVLGTTGILTETIIKGVCDEIKPDLVILIDSYVSNDINMLCKYIEIKNTGLNPGSAIKGLDQVVDEELLGCKILSIGVFTAINIKVDNKSESYILSLKNIDEFVLQISEILGISINNAISYLE